MLLKSRSHLADAECEHSCSLNTNILSNVTFYLCNLLELFVVTYSRNLIHMRGVQCLQKIKRSCMRLSNNSSCLVGRMWETLAKSKASNYKLFSVWKELICSVGLWEEKEFRKYSEIGQTKSKAGKSEEAFWCFWECFCCSCGIYQHACLQSACQVSPVPFPAGRNGDWEHRCCFLQALFFSVLMEPEPHL